MAITNLYPNLPAHLVQFKDGGLSAVDQATDRSGKSLLLLGTAYDGPVMEPVQIDASTVAKVFGDEVDSNGVSNGSTLTKYAKQAFKNGFRDVRCMRVTGSSASANIVKSTVAEVIQEPVNDTRISIPANAAEDFNLEHAPVNAISLNIKVDNILRSGICSLDPGTGVISLFANSCRQYAALTASYQYYDVEQKTIEVALKSMGENGELGFDLADVNTVLAADSQALYKSGDAGNDGYATNGFVSLADSSDDEITDDKYTVNKTGYVDGVNTGKFASLVIADPADIALEAGDTVKVTVYAASLVDVTDEDLGEVAGTYDMVANALLKEVAADSMVIAGKTEGTDYVIDGLSIKFKKEGKWEPGTVTLSYTTPVTYYNEESFIVNSVYGGKVYNEAKVEFRRNDNNTMRIIFTKPASKIESEADKPFYFDTAVVGEDGIRTVGHLRDQLENYSYNNVFEIICDNEDLLLESFPEGIYQLTGGSDGVNATADEMFRALSGTRWSQEDADNGDCSQAQVGYLKEQGAYQLLENYKVDFIIPVGVYADVVPPTAKALHTTFHNELALVCAVLTYRTKMTHGFIDVKPNVNTTLKGVETHAQKLLSYDNIHYMQDQDGNVLVDSEGTKMDIGWYTSIVVGPDPIMISDKLGRYYGSAAIAYAALCKSLKPESAPTNKKIPGAVGMKYTFSNKQMNDLVGNRMVVFKTKNSSGTSARSSEPYVVDGCTAGAPNCDYGRITTVQIVTDVVDQIREVCEPFLGEPNTVEQRNAMSALISKRLGKLLEDGEIQWYEFQVQATIQEVLLGECSITLTLIVPQELRKITTTVALRAAA